MNLRILNWALQGQDRHGRWLFTAGQLRRLAGDSPKTFEVAVRRHCESAYGAIGFTHTARDVKGRS